MRDFQQNLIDLLYPDFNYKTKTFVSRVQLRTDVREVFFFCFAMHYSDFIIRLFFFFKFAL